MKLPQRIILTTASFVLGLNTLNTKDVSAAIVTYDFSVTSPSINGQGRFTYDDTSFNSDPIPTAPVLSLFFSFDGDSTVYTNTDDINFPSFPLVFSTTLITGADTIGLDFLFNDENPLSDLSYEIVGLDFTAFSRNDPNILPIFGAVSYTQVSGVPESSSLAGILFFCSAAWLIKRCQLD